MSQQPALLEQFFNKFRQENPFNNNRITAPGRTATHVPEIHAQAFQQLIYFINQARRGEQGVGVMVHGEAGIGKSHLLAQACAWAEEQGAIYVFLHNLQAAPERIPRYILKSIMQKIAVNFHDDCNKTIIMKIMQNIIKNGIINDKSKIADSNKLRLYCNQYIKKSNSHYNDAQAFDIIFELFIRCYMKNKVKEKNEFFSLALNWLSGNAIDKEDAKKFDLPLEANEEGICKLIDDEEISSVISALSHLALLNGIPIILFFDQVDNLKDEQVRNLSIFIQALLDHIPNLCVVTSGVQNTLVEFKARGVIEDAAWDRLAKEKILLQRISASEAKYLLQSRLENYLAPFIHAPEIAAKLQHDSFFPLGQHWVSQLLGETLEFRSREVINKARDGFRRQQSALQVAQSDEVWLRHWPTDMVPIFSEKDEAVIDAVLAQRLQENIEQRKRDPAGLPPDASNLCGLLAAVLAHCAPEFAPEYPVLGIETPGVINKRKPAYQLKVKTTDSVGVTITTGITVSATHSKISTLWSLRRILEDLDKNPDYPQRVILVTDARIPLINSLGKDGRSYHDKLRANHADRFQEIELEFKHYLELDALQTLVGDARCGDIDIVFPDGRYLALKEQEAIASLHRRNCYRQHPLLQVLLQSTPLAKSSTQEVISTCFDIHAKKLDSLDIEQYIMAQLGLNMGMSSLEVTNKYIHHKKAAERDKDAYHDLIKKHCLALGKAGKINVTPMGELLSLMYRS